jgi:hypothetical protein
LFPGRDWPGFDNPAGLAENPFRHGSLDRLCGARHVRAETLNLSSVRSATRISS